MEEELAARDAELGRARARVDEVEAQIGRAMAKIDEQAAELGRREAAIGELERVADRVAERALDRERELAKVREELYRLRGEGEQRLASLAVLAEELVALRGQARGQATRIRLRALRDAAELAERVSELTRRPIGMRERLLGSLERAIERIADECVEGGDLAATNGDLDVDPCAVFEGLVEVEIGPFADFSQLVGFEDAAGAIAATSEISVRRFARGRATLDLKLTEPVELLRELEERAPFEFRVRDTRSDRLILDLDED